MNGVQLLSYTFAFHSTAGGFPTLLGSQQRQQTTKTNQKKKLGNASLSR
jgi:hypothetical protein